MPSASSPLSVAGPSAMTLSGSTRSPSETSTRWLYALPWFERANFMIG